MWRRFSSIILRNRLAIIIAIGLLTVFFGYHARQVKMSYEMAQMLPKDDSTYLAFQNFKEKFGSDGSIMVIGVADSSLFELKNFQEWYTLTKDLKEIEGINNVLSMVGIFNLKKNQAEKKFEPEMIFKRKPQTQQEVDSLIEVVHSLPFYEGLIYTEDKGTTLAALTLDKDLVNSKDRSVLMDELLAEIDEFKDATGIEVHYSGLPYIRSYNTTKVSKEIKMFILLAILVTSLILLLFFRSFKAMLFAMTVVAIGVIWTVGFQVLLGFELTILTGLIPPLMIVIGIPNCVYIINKYHNEFKSHGNQIKALTRVVQKIGNAVFLTNTTTALGFATFMFTSTMILVEFGIVATIGVFSVFLVSITLMPIILSFQKPPSLRHVKHLERQWLKLVINRIIVVVTNYRKWVYIIAIALFLTAIYGITKIKTTGNIADDLPRHDPVFLDLLFFEKNFKGVLPFEITVDTKEKGGALKLNNLQKIDKLGNLLEKYPEFSKAVSMVEGLKFAKQAFYGGMTSKYELYNRNEMAFIGPYLKNSGGKGEDLLKAYVDSNQQVTRITAQMADVGTERMEQILTDLKPRVDSIFPPQNYDVVFTGTSVTWLAGTEYLVHNLFSSLAIAVFLISLIMAFLFTSARMVFMSLVPNILPQMVTAACMGYFGISLKPSTILVFSIAYGISVDATIHFLAGYRDELKKHALNYKQAVIISMKETGISMIYTAIILFFGFGVFAASDFGGTVALGTLVSLTLFVAMLSNLILLPSLLLSFDQWITTKSFKKEPMLRIMDEERNIDLNELEVYEDDPDNE